MMEISVDHSLILFVDHSMVYKESQWHRDSRLILFVAEAWISLNLEEKKRKFFTTRDNV